MPSSESTPALNWVHTFVIGLGFFTTALTWPMYNNYVPVFLKNMLDVGPFFIIAGSIVGIVMILDNIAAITLQPYIGSLSDRIRTRFGRRMPFLLIGIPLSAALFILIPIPWGIFAAADPGTQATLWLISFLILVTIVSLFNITMALYRAPVVALMPDLVPSQHRSKANGVINFMGGVGGVFALIGGALIFRLNPLAAFIVAGILMVLSLLILFIFVKEPDRPPATKEEAEETKLYQSFKEIIKSSDKSGLFILLAIFCWFTGYGAIETFWSTFATERLLVSSDQASLIIGAFALFLVIGSIPAGYLGTRFGRRKTIMFGLSGLIPVLSLAAISAIISDLGFGSTYNSVLQVGGLIGVIVLFMIAGLFWACVNINSIVIVWEIGKERLGAFTGLYYLFSAAAAIFAPPVFGIIFDITRFIFEITPQILTSDPNAGVPATYYPMWPLAIIFFIIALLFVSRVRSGETTLTKEAISDSEVGEN